MSRWRWPIAALALIAILITAGLWRVDVPQRRLVAIFSQTVGVYAGSDVRVLGIRIGSVSAVIPAGRTVRVELRYDHGYDIPADAQAVIVPPSLVSDRYIQLTPAYSGGPTLADQAELPVTRTVVPLEIDDIYRSLDELNKALGPSGANATGALSDLVGTARRNLDGNGAQLHDTLSGLAQALSTLADGRDDLFGTVANLAEFSNALARSDQQIRQFNQRLAAVGDQLAGEREDLAAALHSLAAAMADIKAFVRDNRVALVADVAALADVTGILVREQVALTQVLDVAPLALSDLSLAYNAKSGTLDTRDDVMGPYDAASYVCSQMASLVPIAKIPKTCFDLAKLFADHHLPLTDQLRKLLGALPLVGGAPIGTTAPTSLTTGSAPPASADLSLRSLLGGGLR